MGRVIWRYYKYGTRIPDQLTRLSRTPPVFAEHLLVESQVRYVGTKLTRSVYKKSLCTHPPSSATTPTHLPPIVQGGVVPWFPIPQVRPSPSSLVWQPSSFGPWSLASPHRDFPLSPSLFLTASRILAYHSARQSPFRPQRNAKQRHSRHVHVRLALVNLQSDIRSRPRTRLRTRLRLPLQLRTTPE